MHGYDRCVPTSSNRCRVIAKAVCGDIAPITPFIVLADVAVAIVADYCASIFLMLRR